MIQSLLIANRGEIACRIIRTARALGIRTVAVYSEADADALHVREADEAVAIGPAPARESYLVGERIIAAAKETGAEAIHPGYGFLSENAEFAEAVQAAGLVWVGAPPASISAMGLKDAAKALMIEAGVPVTPGYLGEDQSPERLKAEADAIGYPVLIKAVAGGGGKGMRLVEAAGEFADALQSCRREAASSFGDDRVLIEKYILSPRHIEVQVFGDSHGQVVHLFERDCSLQRRHQKVIEEAPAPGMDAGTRASLCASAVRAAQAVDYVGAGTIEFIADASEGLRADRIWFMEMNTRLQVEHPVTEMITGLDLVEWQLRVAAGEPLPLRQDEIRMDGWAMEARVYAENPATGFLPSTGVIEHLEGLSPSDAGGGVRIDSGVEPGGEVTPFYDPMIAKVIAHAPSRTEAAETLAYATGSVEVWPVRTNAGFLCACAQDESFLAGEVDTGFIERRADVLTQPPPLDAQDLEKFVDNLVWDGATFTPHQRSPWRSGLTGFRLNAPPSDVLPVWVDGERVDVAMRPPGNMHRMYRCYDALFVDGWAYAVSLTPPLNGGTAGGRPRDGALLAPMPGRVVALAVEAGQRVAKGAPVVTLEAMKMEHGLVAPFDAVVAEAPVAVGQQVTEGALLVRLEPAPVVTA